MPLTLTIKTIEINSAPLIVGTSTTSGAVKILQETPIPLTQNTQALITPSSMAAGGAAVTFEIDGQYASPFSVVLWGQTDVLSNGLFGLGTCNFNSIGTAAVPSPQTVSLNLPVMQGSGGSVTQVAGFLPSTGFLMMKPVNWRFYFADSTGNPIDFPAIAVTTNSEIYFQPEATGPIDIAAVRLGVTKDLPLGITTTGSANLPSQLVGKCVLAAWAAPPVYDAAVQPYYVNGNFQLTDWLNALNGVNPNPADCDCMDATAMCCLILRLQNDATIGQVGEALIQPVGPLQPNIVLRGAAPPISSFDWHAVAIVFPPGSQIPYICDASTGPHLGSEQPEQYLAALENPVTEPRNPYWYEYSAFYNPPFMVDGEAFPPEGATSPGPDAAEQARRHAFAAAVGASSNPTPGTNLVSCSWPDPASSPAVPHAFASVYHRLSIGYPVTARYWVLADGANALHVRLWVASDSAATAWNRFLEEGSGHTGSGSIFQRGIGVGHASGVRSWSGGKEHLWVRGNVVFRVTLTGRGLDVDAFAEWLDGLASAATSSAAGLPVMDIATSSNSSPAVGERITLDVVTGAGHSVRLFGARPRLRLVDGDGRRLTLLALEKGRAEISVVVCNPDTLFSAKKPLILTVV